MPCAKSALRPIADIGDIMKFQRAGGGRARLSDSNTAPGGPDKRGRSVPSPLISGENRFTRFDPRFEFRCL
jgi:hypothetical protein